MDQVDNCVEILSGVQDLIILVTPDGKIEHINRAVEIAAKRPIGEIVGQGVCTILHGGKLPHADCPLEQLLQEKESHVLETRLPGLYGDYLLTISPSVNKEGKVRHILLFARELTSDEMLRVENQRTSQLAAIGELAAGVAHEINNPINGIINFAQFLLDDCEDSEKANLLKRIVNEGERISSIIYKLLSFAREEDKEKVALDVNQAVLESLGLIQHQLRKDGITIIAKLADGLPMVLGNFQQIQQVVLNLISNSRYALNEKYAQPASEKKIFISSIELATPDGKKVVRTTIKDMGRGIPQGLLERVCDPFFTTKPSGEGTGLGLSITHGILQDHGGSLRVNSVLHKYTEISFDLPLYDAKSS